MTAFIDEHKMRWGVEPICRGADRSQKLLRGAHAPALSPPQLRGERKTEFRGLSRTPGADKGFINPSRRSSVTLPKCRGCGREHQVKMRGLHLLGDAFRNGDDIYVGD
jgi:hypothetical protein